MLNKILQTDSNRPSRIIFSVLHHWYSRDPPAMVKNHSHQLLQIYVQIGDNSDYDPVLTWLMKMVDCDDWDRKFLDLPSNVDTCYSNGEDGGDQSPSPPSMALNPTLLTSSTPN